MATQRTHITPNGGVRSVAHYFAADGTELNTPEGAITVEIEEFGPLGGVVARTYGDLQSGVSAADQASVDAFGEPEVSDMKGSWDIRHPETQEPVSTLDDLILALGLSPDPEQLGRSLARMLELPVWNHAPDALTAEVYEHLRGS